MANQDELNLLAPGALEELKAAYASVKDLGDLIVEVNGKLKQGEGAILSAAKVSEVNKAIESQVLTMKDLVDIEKQLQKEADAYIKFQIKLEKQAQARADAETKASQKILDNLEKERIAKEKASIAEEKYLLKLEKDMQKRISMQEKQTQDEIKQAAAKIAAKEREIIAEEKLMQKLEADLNKRLAAQQKEVDALIAKEKEEEKILEALANDYLLLSKAMKDAQDKARMYAAALTLAHPATVQAIADANALRDQVTKIDFAVGDFTKNVGNYNGVGTQFNQLLRELPNAGISLQTFILSLSNNISYFAEAVKIARASGQSWGAILGTLGQSMFGLVGIINIAVAAVILFGDKIFSAFKEKGEEAAEGITKLQKAVASLKQEVEDFKVPTFFDTQNLDALDKGEAAMKRQIDLAKARGASDAEILNKEQALKRIQIQNIKDEIKLYESRETSIIRFDAEIYELKQKQKDLENGILVDQAAFETKIRDKSNKEYEKYLKQREALAQAMAQVSLKNRTKESIEELEAVAQELGTNTGNIITDALVKSKGEAMQRELSDQTRRFQATLNGIDQSFLNGLYKNTADYEKAKADAVNAGAKERFEIEKKYLQAMIDLLPIDSEKRREFQDKLAKVERDLYQELTNDKLKSDKAAEKGEQRNFDIRLRNIQKFAQRAYQAVNGIFNEIGNLVNSQAEARLSELDVEKEKLEENAEIEIAKIERSRLSEEQKEEAIRYQEGETANQRKRIAFEEAQIKQRQARFDKAANIARIIGQTALAIISALADTTLPYPAKVAAAIASGAAGSVQLATAIAAPIPAYKHGTDRHKGGKFIAGDGGERELVQHPDGSAYWTGDNPAVYDAPAGTRVIPESKLASSVANMGIVNLIRRKQAGEGFNTKNLERIIRNKQMSVVLNVQPYKDELKYKVSRR